MSAGTIGAARNGVGVIGVMPSGADIHVVRIWNDSGDVSQGQGPYATDLILAYDNCLTHLKEQQKTDRNTKMVINMSFGSAGPLTIERLWITRAAKRGDVLFVGSAGNNGTFLASAVGASNSGQQAVDPGQYMSYPASYDLEEVRRVEWCWLQFAGCLVCAMCGVCVRLLLVLHSYPGRFVHAATCS
jgi:hypothetical protein